jgi:uncharacterized protein YfiM (DUF2279 family)
MTRPPLVVEADPWSWCCAIVVTGCGPEALSWSETDRATEPAAMAATAAAAARMGPGRRVRRWLSGVAVMVTSIVRLVP